MSQIASIPVLHSAAACLLSRTGAFVLPAAQALALHPKEASSIRITCGSAWITLGDGMDHFLEAGQSLHAPAGSRVVMESMQRGRGLKFDWQRALPNQSERSQLRGCAHAVDTEAGVSPLQISPLAQALRDLRGAADLAARGLAGLATALAAGLTRGFGTGLAALARSAHSSASRAQARMASCESIASSGAV